MKNYHCFKSAYIDRVLQQVHQCEENVMAQGDGKIPKYVMNIILSHLLEVICKGLLKGYSEVRKCSDPGRKLMEKDIKGLKDDLTSYIGLDLPCFDKILLYLQQYYYYPEKILKFIKINPQYEIRHIMGLVKTAPEIKKLRKNEIKNLITNIEAYYVEYLSRNN
mmetsp:Transcript_29852/g.26399  ORF Transcript_29852/g.26399 Transcript_29852/m.26399 type:complete len:164 (-) Transcript_29852:13-504(-)